MKLNKAIAWVMQIGKCKPSESISDARWLAMVKHIYREYPRGLNK